MRKMPGGLAQFAACILRHRCRHRRHAQVEQGLALDPKPQAPHQRPRARLPGQVRSPGERHPKHWHRMDPLRPRHRIHLRGSGAAHACPQTHKMCQQMLPLNECLPVAET